MEDVFNNDAVIEDEEEVMESLCEVFGIEDEDDIEEILSGSVGIEDF